MRDKRAIYLSIVLEANEDGYLASVPGLQGAFAEGDTFEEAIFNCVDVVKLIAAYRSERGESLGFPSHELWVRDADGRVVPVPHHRGKSIRAGTVRAIIRETGVSVDEFMDL